MGTDTASSSLPDPEPGMRLQNGLVGFGWSSQSKCDVVIATEPIFLFRIHFHQDDGEEGQKEKLKKKFTIFIYPV